MENKKNLISLVLVAILYPTHSYSSDTRPRIGQNIIIAPNEVNNLVRSQNGTDVINIKAPDKSGTSHNVFHKFDVNGKLIFNNSASLGISQIGGIVGKNPNFKNMQTADSIINEIKSTQASNISGILEVFGNKADLIFANENGLVVNGAVFLNTKGITLTTANLDNNLLTINTPSAIEIGEKGMSVDGKYANLIAGKINLAGSITSTNDIPLSNIALIAGKNKLNLMDKQFPAIIEVLPNNDASYGIDGRLIGSMYAKSVTFLANNEGIGVRHTGIIRSPKDIAIISTKGDTQLHTVTNNSKNGSLTIIGNNISSTLISSDSIKMEANKNIDNHGIIQGTRISIKANSLNNLVTDKNFLNIEQHKDSNKYPTYMVADTLRLDLSNQLTNQGIINANSMNITSSSIDNSEMIMGNNAVLTLSNSIFKNSGKVALNENLTIHMGKRNENLDLDLGNTYAKNTLTIQSNSNLNINKKIENIGSISLEAPEIKNNSVIATPKNITITNTDKYYNFGHLFAGENISLNTFALIDNSQLIEGWGNLNITTRNLTNTASIFSKGDLHILTKVLNNNSQLYGSVSSQRLYTVGNGGVNYGDTVFKTWHSNIRLDNIPSYTNKLNTKQATIQSQGNLTINKNLPPQGNFVNNNGGIISAAKNMEISANINNTTLSNSLRVEDILRMIYVPNGVRNNEYLGSWNTNWANYFQRGANLLQVLQYFSSSSLANHQKESAWNAIKNAAAKNPNLHQYLSLYLGSNYAFNRTIPEQNRWNKNARLVFPSHNKAQIVSNQRIHIEANKVVQNLSTKLDTSFALLKSNVNLLSQTQKFIKQSLDEVRDNGFFIENKNSTNPIKYRYETPFSWIEQSGLYGSSYFFEKMGYSQDRYTVIGDSYFEYQLLNNMHGKISSNVHRLTNEQIKTLMDSGVKYSKHNNIKLGQTLTQNQINGLKEDIILYTNLGTENKPVFSPVIYFGQNTLKALNQDNFYSTIHGKEGVFIKAEQVSNQLGKTTSDRDIGIAASKIFENISSLVDAKNVLIQAKEAKISTLLSVDSSSKQDSLLQSKINATKNLQITTTNDLMIKNSILSATDKDSKINLIAIDGNVFILNDYSNSSSYQEKGNDSSRTVVMTQESDVLSSQITGGSIGIASQKDVTIQGSNLKAGQGGIGINAKNVNIKAAESKRAISVETIKNGTNNQGVAEFASSTENATSTQAKGSTIDSQKSIAIKTSGNLNILGSHLTGAEAIQLIGDYINIAQTYNTTNISSEGKNINPLGYSQHQSNSTESIAVGSTINANLVNMQANNVDVTGSGITGGDINIHADTVNFKAAENKYSSDKNSFGVGVFGETNAQLAGHGKGIAYDYLTGQKVKDIKGFDGGITLGGVRSDVLANGEVGLKIGEQKQTINSTYYTSSNIDGKNININANNSADIGGSNLSATENINIYAGEIKTTKYTDIMEMKDFTWSFYIKEKVETTSPIVGAVNQAAEQITSLEAGKQINAGIAISQMVTNSANIISNQLINGSSNQVAGLNIAGNKNSSSKQNITSMNAGKNLNLVSTKGDIELNGTALNAENININAQKELLVKAAENTNSSENYAFDLSASFQQNGGLGLRDGATGTLGADMFVNFEYSQSKGNTYTNSTINANKNLNVHTGTNAVLIGVNAKGEQVVFNIGENLSITSVIDTRKSETIGFTGNAKVGLGLSSNHLVAVNGGGMVGANYQYLDSQSVNQQSQISASKSANIAVGNDLNLNASIIHSDTNKGLLSVKGTINDQSIATYTKGDGAHVRVSGNTNGAFGGVIDINDHIEKNGKLISGVNIDIDNNQHNNINKNTSGTFTETDNSWAGGTMNLNTSTSKVKQLLKGGSENNAGNEPYVNQTTETTQL